MLIAQTNAGYDFPTANRVVHLDAGDTNSYSGSGTTWSDLTSNNNDFTLSSCTFDSANGGSIEFDGSNSQADRGSELTFSKTSNTMMFWVNQDQNNLRGLVNRYATNSYNSFISFADRPSRAETDSNCNNFTYEESVTDNDNIHSSVRDNWTCWTIRTNSDQSADWFLNGTRRIPVTSWGSINCDGANPASNFYADLSWRYLGTATTYEGRYDGKLAMICQWNVALTDHQIQAAFGSYRSRFGV